MYLPIYPNAPVTTCMNPFTVSGPGWTSVPGKQIFYGEFDGKRKKQVLVKIIGE